MSEEEPVYFCNDGFLQARYHPAFSTQRTASTMIQETQLGTHHGVSFTVAAWSPAKAQVDLSIACMFEREAGDAPLTGGLLELDHAFDGSLTAARRQKNFVADELDSLLLKPSAYKARALPRVLVIGLGDPSEFTPRLMNRVTRFALHQAIRLNATSVAFAPSLLDSGIHVTPQDEVEKEMSHGVLQALVAEDALCRSGLSPAFELRHWYFDAGVNHFTQASHRYLSCFADDRSKQLFAATS